MSVSPAAIPSPRAPSHRQSHRPRRPTRHRHRFRREGTDHNVEYRRPTGWSTDRRIDLRTRLGSRAAPQLEAELRESTGRTNAPTTPADELTHIERISRAAGDDISGVTDSVAASQAIALWRNLPKWGTKTPKGYYLRPKYSPKRLLEANQCENLAWKQYYRAAEALERLSEGTVTFFDSDTHGKMLVLHEQSELFSRVRASLTASTAHPEG